MAPSRGEKGELGEREDMAAATAASVSGEEASSSYASSYDSSCQEVAWNWKQEALVVAKLWCVGFWDACCLNRAYLCCRRCVRLCGVVELVLMLWRFWEDLGVVVFWEAFCLGVFVEFFSCGVAARVSRSILIWLCKN